MTPSLIRGRPRRATSHICARVTYTLLGALVGVVWLVLPGATAPERHAAPVGASASTDETSSADLVLPLVAVGAAVLLGGYGYVRRTRRARTRTTPAAAAVPTAPDTSSLAELDERARQLLVEADDAVRTRREEVDFLRARVGPEAAEPHAQALRGAEAELAAAFRIRQQYEDGVPEDETSRRHALTGSVGRCQEARRRLEGFDRGDPGEALEFAETRFRDLTARTGATEAVLTRLAERYGPTATGPVTGYVEQAKDLLVIATTHLNQVRQSTDLDDEESAVRHLRAAETSTARADALLSAVDRLASDLPAAESLLPATLTGAEAELAAVSERADADRVLAAVREEVAARPYDPLDALRRVVGATAPLGAGRDGVLSAAALLVARNAVATADTHITVRRESVGSTARTRLAEARRLLLTDPWSAAVRADQSMRSP
ncbi:hypothetical protein [Streptomyces gilvus]|uniref:hypothetical protein n=1 Tax=Streptomyces gilvus TaxID=2920937 RepID=UPI001F0E9A45|nr:hypothetical protein [Streptomyces sp. CME 23]MCH5672862.1 hypothetical protein [Streptomyces sp. CME 23]